MGLAESPERLRALAGEVDTMAEEVTALSAELQRLGEDMAWQSLAAESYRTRLETSATDTVVAAGTVDDLGDALRAHADGVEQTIMRIQAARDFLLGALEQARSVVSDFVGGVIELFTSEVSQAQDVVAAADLAPSTDIDLGWLDRAHDVGWRG